MRNITTIPILAVLLAASSAYAAGPTVGWEWEVKHWAWVSINKKTGEAYADQKTIECPDKLFATSVKSPVNDTVKLVSFTRDLSGQKKQKLEIITGPIDYDDDTGLDRIMKVMRAFTEAAATCTESHGQCRIGIADLAQHMTANSLMTNAAADGGAITFVVDPMVATFNNPLQECVLIWDKSYDTSRTNTQTNVGLDLSSVATGKLEGLFSQYKDQSSGWEVSRRGYRQALDLLAGNPDNHPVSGIPEGLSTAPAQGLFALLAYLMNAETYATQYKKVKTSWRGWEGKSVQDVYLKTSPAELVTYVRNRDPAARTFFDKLPSASEEENAELASTLCVAGTAEGATDLDCRPRLDAMIALLANPTDGTYRTFLSDIPKPIPMFQRYGKDAFVVEARRRKNPINKASTFYRKNDGSIDLVDRNAVRAKLDPFEWH